MICREVQINKKIFVTHIDSELLDSNIDMLFLKFLSYYLDTERLNGILNTYTEKPECIRKLGYSSLGNLVIRNIKFENIIENEYLYLAEMCLDFNVSKLDTENRVKVIEIFKYIVNLFKVPNGQGRTRQLSA